MKPDYYILVGYEGFENAIDSIGGLEVEVDKQLDYDDNWGNLHIHLKEGKQLLNGEDAIWFVRYRKGNDGRNDSDLVRILRQQRLMQSLKDRLNNPGVMFKVPKLLDKIRDDIDGNLTVAQMVCLARFFDSIPSSSRIIMETIPSDNNGGAYIRANEEETAKLVKEMFFSSAECEELRSE